MQYNDPDTIEEIYTRYELENYLQDKISNGDTEGALEAFQELSRHPFPREVRDNSIYFHSYESALASIRTLARKAAERGGLSVITIDEIMTETEEKIRQAAWKSECGDIMVWLIRTLTDQVHAAKENADGCSLEIRKCLEYIQQHYMATIHLTDLAELTGLSEGHLSTKFREETGATISERIMTIRCEKAENLLKKTDLPIREISSYVGYPDNNYFVKVFRKKYGMTPSAYRSGK